MLDRPRRRRGLPSRQCLGGVLAVLTRARPATPGLVPGEPAARLIEIALRRPGARFPGSGESEGCRRNPGAVPGRRPDRGGNAPAGSRDTGPRPPVPQGRAGHGRRGAGPRAGAREHCSEVAAPAPACTGRRRRPKTHCRARRVHTPPGPTADVPAPRGTRHRPPRGRTADSSGVARPIPQGPHGGPATDPEGNQSPKGVLPTRRPRRPAAPATSPGAPPAPRSRG